MRLLFTLIILVFGHVLLAQNAKIDPRLIEELDRNDQVGCLIYMKEQAELPSSTQGMTKEEKGRKVFEALQITAQTSQSRIQQWLQSEQVDYRSFLLVNALYVRADLTIIQTLSTFSEVKYIMHDSPVRVETPVEIEYHNDAIAYRDVEPEWGIRMIKADSLWLEGAKGEGVVIAGQDTGYDYEHPAIVKAYRGNLGDTIIHAYSWHDAIHTNDIHYPDSIPNPCGFDVEFPCDDGSHGTHTMGTMVGFEGDNIIGVAPEADWIGCRNMDRGWGTPASYIECFEFFLAPTDLSGENPDVTKAPHVINNSWACPPAEGCNPMNFDIMNQVILNLNAAGIVVVVSAGNSGTSGCGSVSSPAAIFDPSFTVGATTFTDSLNFEDSIAHFSSRGPVVVDSSFRIKPDVVAPGRFVRSCVPNNGYAISSGTSMAGPHVAGAVALLISYKPELAGQVDMIEYILRTSAKPKMAVDTCGNVPGTVIPNYTYGYGRIDMMEAKHMVDSIFIVHANDGTAYLPSFDIYPNPARDAITVEFSDGNLGQIDVINMLGNVVITKQVQHREVIPMNHFPKGIYYIRWRQAGKLVNVKKLILQ